MDDFFSTGGQGVPETSTTKEDLATFEAAIGQRFRNASPSLLTTKMTLATKFPRTPAPADHPSRIAILPPTPSRTPSGPLSQLSLSSKLPVSPTPARNPHPSIPDQSSEFVGYHPKDIPALLRSSSSSSSSSSLPPSVLLIDIRNHHQYVESRIAGSINLSVPSTLLKRPAFVLSRLSEMITFEDARTIFSSWPRSQQIIVFDTDTGVLSAGNNVMGLLRKFKNEGYQGQMGFIVGGFNAVQKYQPDCLDKTPIAQPTSTPLSSTGASMLTTSMLPSSAFQRGQLSSSWSTISTVGVPGAKMSLRLGDDGSRLTVTKPTNLAVANPFYDNIRQNLELSSGITERIPLVMPKHLEERWGELPFGWLRDIVRKASARSADGIIGGEALEDLAMQFYRIELGEQRRLTGVMEHHSNESTTRPEEFREEPKAFPYSITAGVEMGAKNRYRNIWPFEHARVRLAHPADRDSTGYINASYVQPRGTGLKYIATQGPLAATFTDFWTLCWEQNVGIIVMLTKQVEGQSVKCHCYWKDEVHGPLRLKLLSVEGPVEQDPEAAVAGNNVGFDFVAPLTTPGESPMRTGGTNEGHAQPTTEYLIRRTFLLSNVNYPSAPPRKIVQLQFLTWPDLNVPDSSSQLLELIHELDILRAEFRSIGGSDPVHAREKVKNPPGPVLVHCSAGVGRTGSFVIIDAMLDAVRREARRQRQARRAGKQLSQGSEESSASADTKHSSLNDGFLSAIYDERRSSVVNLDASGNELPSPDAHSIKKRKSSSIRDNIKPDKTPTTNLLSSPTTSPPPVPALPRQPFEFDSPMASSSQKRGLVYGASPAPMSTDSLQSLAPSVGTPSTRTSASGSFSTAPTSYYSSKSDSPVVLDPALKKNEAAFLYTSAIPNSPPTNKDAEDVRMRLNSLPKSFALRPPPAMASNIATAGSPTPAPGPRPPVVGGNMSQWRAGVTSQSQAGSSNFPLTYTEGTTQGPIAPSEMTGAAGGLAPSLPIKRHDMRHPKATSTSAYDYEPPRKIILDKKVGKEVRHAEKREQKKASLARSIDNANRPSVLARQLVASPSPLSSSVITANSPGQTGDVSSGNGTTDSAEVVEKTSSDESPSSPEALAEIEEPIRQVLEDMRQQRMSLCQSLRQYVFVHLAILEGSLQIVEQLDAEDAELDRLAGASKRSVSIRVDTSDIDQPVASRSLNKYDPYSMEDTSSSMDFSNNLSFDTTKVNSSAGFSKRPSVKRKKRSETSEIGSPVYERMVIE